MFDQSLRKVVSAVLDPVVSLAEQNKITPNALTIAAFISGLLCALCAGFGWIWLSVVCWIVNRLLDGADGVVARKLNLVTEFGGYLDILADFTTYALIPVALTARNFTPSLALVALVLEATYFVNAAGLFYLSALLERSNRGAKANGEFTSLTMPVGLIEGSETIVAYTLFLLFPSLLLVGFALFGAGVATTILQRAQFAYDNLDGKRAGKTVVPDSAAAAAKSTASSAAAGARKKD